MGGNQKEIHFNTFYPPPAKKIYLPRQTFFYQQNELLDFR